MRPDKNRRHAWPVVLVAGVVLLAGCGDDDGGTNAQAGATTTKASGATTTTEPSAPTTSGEAPEEPVSTATNPQLGEILVDADGLTLYVFDNDKNGTIACVDTCAGAWPPLALASDATLPTTGDLAADLTTVARPDGAGPAAVPVRR